MRRVLRILAALIALAAAGYWLAAGANRGWTRNNVPVKTVDEVTGIEGITYEERLVPGVDFLGAALLAAGLLASASFLFRNPKTETQPQIEIT